MWLRVKSLPHSCFLTFHVRSDYSTVRICPCFKSFVMVSSFLVEGILARNSLKNGTEPLYPQGVRSVDHFCLFLVGNLVIRFHWG